MRVAEKDPGLDFFVAQAKKLPLLTKDQEIKLAKQYRKTGDERIANILVERNIRFVLKVANEYARNPGIPLADLVQEGCLGLVIAVQKFDPTRGFRLTTFAVWWIRAYVQLYVIRNWSLLRLGKTQERILFGKLRTARNDLEAKLHRDATYEELGEALGISADVAAKMEQRIIYRDLSLDSPLGEDGVETFLDHTIDTNTPDALTLLELKQEQQRLHIAIGELMKSMKPKEKMVVLERIMNEEPKTLDSLGKKYGISRERVRQIEARVIEKIKVQLTGAA